MLEFHYPTTSVFTSAMCCRALPRQAEVVPAKTTPNAPIDVQAIILIGATRCVEGAKAYLSLTRVGVGTDQLGTAM